MLKVSVAVTKNLSTYSAETDSSWPTLCGWVDKIVKKVQKIQVGIQSFNYLDASYYSVGWLPL